ncbi:MAG: hypothetical protein Kow0047_24250 [Anaerolineae bacterium]
MKRDTLTPRGALFLGVLMTVLMACAPLIQQSPVPQQQITDLQAENERLRQQVTELQNQLSQLQQQASQSEEAKAALDQQISELQAQIETLNRQNGLLRALAGPPPESLDALFPPEAPGPIWLFEMFALSGALEGILVDLEQGDMEGVQANFEAFKAQYTKVSQLVPEWQSRFPVEPVDALGEALASGDPTQVGPALGQIGQVCGSCHLFNQVKVQQKYHWPDFGEIRVTDPVTDEEVAWVDFMRRMALSYVGITNDLGQGQLDNARQNFEDFRARFAAMEPEGCSQCHLTPRTYFVDQSLQDMVQQVGAALEAETPDAETIGQLLGGIGNESCLKCHLVHFPAARAKARWQRFADVFSGQ